MRREMNESVICLVCMVFLLTSDGLLLFDSHCPRQRQRHFEFPLLT